MIKEIKKCRCCGSSKIKSVFSLGSQYLTGIFPDNNKNEITKGPLELVQCNSSNGCRLVQLKHSYNLNELYGDNYGYRSGLNPSMVKHLKSNVDYIINKFPPKSSKPIIIDIGSNDGTMLKLYPKIKNSNLCGVDPTIKKFKKYYPNHIRTISEFFSYDLLNKKYLKSNKADIITSFSMFYDLENPLKFINDIHKTLSNDGIWVFEQSYLPAMINTLSFDTICQEHLEYYTLNQINWMLAKCKMKINDLYFNDTNGGSIIIYASKQSSNLKVYKKKINNYLNIEIKQGYLKNDYWKEFNKKTQTYIKKFNNFLTRVKKKNGVILGLGASTKGNVLLQYLNITSNEIKAIGEINKDKFNKFTPGSNIPIIPENKALKMNADYYLVLPWHFKDFFLNNNKFKNKNLIFPLPKFKIIKN